MTGTPLSGTRTAPPSEPDTAARSAITTLLSVSGPTPAPPSAPVQLTPSDEAARQAALDRMKRFATGMLLAATAIFIATRLLEPSYPWLGIIRATAEAAMIGGLADWFAVTALFRHPLGIPIPHTAIIPARKDRVGASLGAFVQRNFLNRDVIAAKLASVHPAQRIAHWLTVPENARRIARHAASSLAAGAEMLKDEDVQALIGRTVESRVRATQVAPLLGRLLSLVTAGNRHRALLDELIRLTARAVTDNRDFIKERVEAESPWWIPNAVDSKIASKIAGALERTLSEVEGDPGHPLRARLDEALQDFVDKLQTSPDVIARAESIKEEVLDAEVVRTFSASIWSDAKRAITRHAQSEEGFDPTTIERALVSLGETVLADPALLDRIDGWIADAALAVVDRYQNEIGDLISNTVKAWDPIATSRRIELAIGRDLQFIRINGTIVGGMAGTILYLVSKYVMN